MQSNYLIGNLTGFQVQLRQGGKLKGCENYYGQQISSEESRNRKEENRLLKLKFEEEEKKIIADAAEKYPVLLKLQQLRVPNSHLLRAIAEIADDESDELLKDLARIHEVNYE